VNPLPGLTPDYSDLVLIAKACGMEYDQLIAEIMTGGLRRMREKRREERELERERTEKDAQKSNAAALAQAEKDKDKAKRAAKLAEAKAAAAALLAAGDAEHTAQTVPVRVKREKSDPVGPQAAATERAKPDASEPIVPNPNAN